MAKYDPEKYVTDLTKAAEGIGDTVKKLDDKIKKALDVATTKNNAAKAAQVKVDDLKAEKAKVEDNGRQIANLIATAKGEPLPFPPVTEDDGEPVEPEPVAVV